MDHLAAGIDTTGDGLCFLMHALSLPRYLPAQARLQHELMSNLSTPFHQLPYLDAVVKEGLRCFPPIPMSFPRYVPAGGRSIDGVWIPEGMIVSCQPYTLHKDEAAFPRALEFIPERWLESKGTKEREEMFFAFSKGSRGCLGKKYVFHYNRLLYSTKILTSGNHSLAMAEMKILLREVYSQCSTRISEHIDGDMQMADQIISSRPRNQTCKLAFERIEAPSCSN
jgi:Cytochrome P450